MSNNNRITHTYSSLCSLNNFTPKAKQRAIHTDYAFDIKLWLHNLAVTGCLVVHCAYAHIESESTYIKNVFTEHLFLSEWLIFDGLLLLFSDSRSARIIFSMLCILFLHRLLHRAVDEGKQSLVYVVARRMAALNKLDSKDAEGRVMLWHTTNSYTFCKDSHIYRHTNLYGFYNCIWLIRCIYAF